MATEGGGADVRALLAEAGVAQYADALVAAGYDSLPNVLALDKAGLQDLKVAVNMLPGHFGFLRARIRSTTTAAPPPPAAPPPAAAAGPVPAQQAPRQARAPREDVLKMSSTSRRRGRCRSCRSCALRRRVQLARRAHGAPCCRAPSALVTCMSVICMVAHESTYI
jgi:hypothetical protein